MKTNIEQIINHASSSFSLPSVYTAFQRKLQDPNSTNEHLASIIEVDAGLTSFLLRLVNSAFYSFPSSISSISHAMSIIGRRELSSLVLGKSVVNAFTKSNIPASIINARWERNLYCAYFAKELAKLIAVKDIPSDTAFVAGLIHSVGKFVIWHSFPSFAEKQWQQDDELLNIQLEINELGINYAQVGARLMQYWQLPDKLVNSTLQHLGEPKEHRNMNTVIQVAYKLSLRSTDETRTCAQEKKWITQLSNSTIDDEELQQLIDASHKKVSELKSTFIS